MPQMTIEQMIKWLQRKVEWAENDPYGAEADEYKTLLSLLKRMLDVELPKTPTWTRVEVRSEFGHERYDRYILESEVDALRQSATAQIAALKEKYECDLKISRTAHEYSHSLLKKTEAENAKLTERLRAAEEILQDAKKQDRLSHSKLCDVWDKYPCSCDFKQFSDRIDAALSARKVNP